MSIVINGTERDSQTTQQASINHGMYHINANKKYYEPQRSSSFELVIPDLSGMKDIVTGETIANADEIVRMSVISCKVPHFTINPLEQRRGNSVQKFAGLPKFDAGEMSVWDWIGVNSKSALMAWQHCAYNVNTDKVGVLEDYKHDAYLIEYSPDMQVVRQWIMEGCWVSGVSEQPFDHTADEARKVSATIQYDRARLIEV